MVLTIEGDGGTIAEVERRFRVTDYIIRFISVRIDEDLKRSDKIKAARRKKAPKQDFAQLRSQRSPKLPPMDLDHIERFTAGSELVMPGPIYGRKAHS